MSGIAGSLWAAYNAVAELVDQGRDRRTKDQHLEYIWFGGGYTLKLQAFEMAKKQLVRGAPN